MHVVLARADDPALDQKIVNGNLDYVELGKLKGNQGDQNYDVQAAVDLQKLQRGGHLLRAIQRGIGVAREESL